MLKWIKKLNPYTHRPFITQLLALRAKDGPYRFAIKSWQGISDLNLAAGVLETECFRTEVEPVPLPVESLRSILVLAPHQDDEAIGAGGLMLLAAKAGVKIDVLYVTDGAQNKMPGVDMRPIRESEARSACSKLGATVHQLGISNLSPEPTLHDIDRFAAIIHSIKPDVIMAPWLLDWPPKHRMTNHLLWLAFKRRGLPKFEVWGYQVHNTPFINSYVDITAVADEKASLLKCYVSQNNERRYDLMTMGLAAWNARLIPASPTARFVEAYLALPDVEFFRLVESFYFADLVATYRGKIPLVSNLAALHKSVTGQSLNANGGLQRIARRAAHSLAVALVLGNVLANVLQSLSSQILFGG
jgi:LmbE family N-acetylglucosaminyl deacetylase